ncbi:hypothetical protein, partial [Enterobacter hormaechei]
GSPLVVSGEFRFLGNPCPGGGPRRHGFRGDLRPSSCNFIKNLPNGLEHKNKTNNKISVS